jgi:hypothetical protein
VATDAATARGSQSRVCSLIVVLCGVVSRPARIFSRNSISLARCSSEQTTACCALAVAVTLMLLLCRCSVKVSFNHSLSARQSFELCPSSSAN